MMQNSKTILVFGATGQQGGSVVSGLLAKGWKVRALVRHPDSQRSLALAARGVELMRGDFADPKSIQTAMAGSYGVFSVQPSSGQGALYNVNDADEVRYGVAVADLALKQGVRHLIYSSANATADAPSGMGHFDSKAQIEAHIRTLPIPWTIIRPAAFMELMAMPGFGLPQGVFTFFMRPEQRVQFIAARDIGRIVAAIFSDVERFRSETLEIAGDALTGTELAAQIGAVIGRSVSYLRFPDDVLASNPFFAGLAKLYDNGRLAGHADIAKLRKIEPALMLFKTWLDTYGQRLFRAAARVE